ncbi:bifunctional 3-(3-hydroxy-phenyl)propionate/3-hydroxycinnamic acid hydroxylase [soil metagenome]
MSKTTFDYDVAILGYGPTSVMAANYLGKFGIKTLIIERDEDVYSRARAVTVDGTTIRLFQGVGLDDAAKATMDVTTALRWKTYGGHEFLRWTPGGEDVGHAPSYMIFQPKLEAVLREGVQRYREVVDIRFGHELVSFSQDDSSVTVVERNKKTGTDTSHRVKYMIGADGGSSKVRQDLGIQAVGETRERTWIVIDAKIKRWWPERELLTFWSDPDRPVVDIPLAQDYHRWEIPLAEGEKKEDFQSKEIIWGLLKPLGVTPEQVELTHHAFYSHHVRMASTWRVRRVLLAGDAAHLMPPWAGQGMQSGIRDGVNLAWKLRYVLQNGVSDEFLDTYQQERQPHTVMMTTIAVELGKLIETEKGAGQVLRNLMLPIISKNPITGPKMQQNMAPKAYLEAGFFSVPPTSKTVVGKMIIQPLVATQNGHRALFDNALGNDFAIVGLDVDPREVMTAAQQAAWAVFEPRYITVRTTHSKPRGSDEIVDFTQALEKWLKPFGARVVVLRPDRVVAASDNTSLDVPKLRGTGLLKTKMPTSSKGKVS